MRSRLALLALLLAGCAPESSPELPRPSERRGAEPTRSVWITRWDYRTAEDVERIVGQCADAGFDELLFQVRGNATTFYPSKLEPWAAELGGADPGFDPLALALELARARGLRLQAWVNAVPAWWGTEPPTDPAHVVNAHPEWLWYDAGGARQPYSERFYVSLNPCLPEVREHVVAVMEELLENYAVDGLHLDYIRFPNEPPATPEGLDYPRDARTLELYREARGLTPDDDLEAWNEWRAEQVTELVRQIRGALWRARPEARLTAAVSAEAPSAAAHFQDWPTWIEQGLVDGLYPMNYVGDAARHAARNDDWEARSEEVTVRMGLHVTSVEPAVQRERMRDAQERFGGYSLFGYLYLWDSCNNVIDAQSAERSRERAALREALLPLEER